MLKINYDAGTTVHMFDKDPATSAMARAGPVGSGTTLAAAVRYVMAMPPAIRACATIAVGHEAGTEDTLLKPIDIERIFARPDFPKG